MLRNKIKPDKLFNLKAFKQVSGLRGLNIFIWKIKLSKKKKNNIEKRFRFISFLNK